MSHSKVYSTGGEVGFNNLLFSDTKEPVRALGQFVNSINEDLRAVNKYCMDVGKPISNGWDGGPDIYGFSRYNFGLTPTSLAIGSGIIPLYSTSGVPPDPVFVENLYQEGFIYPHTREPDQPFSATGILADGFPQRTTPTCNHIFKDSHMTTHIDTFGGFNHNSISGLEHVFVSRYPPVISRDTFDCGYDESVATPINRHGAPFIIFVDF